MTDYAAFFLDSRSSVVQLELLEISHPEFSKTYRVVRNATNGITVTLEDGTQQTFDYYPLKISGKSLRENLDFGLEISLGDVGEILNKEMDNLEQTSSYDQKLKIVYRTYRSDDLSEPLFGPAELEVSSFNFTREGATFEAHAPHLNNNVTGEMYRIDRFPMLRGFL